MGAKTRFLLGGSMAGLLLVTAVTGAAALAAFARIHREESALRARTLAAARRLEQVRSAIYLSAAGTETPASLALLRDETLRNLADAQTTSLRGEVAAWFEVLGLMNEMAARRRSAGVDAWFRQQLAQRRTAMLKIAGSIAAAQDQEWQAGQQELDALYARFRWVLGMELAVGFGLGLAVVAFTLRRMARLEAQAHQLAAQLAQAQEEERRAIARELHDEVGQALSGVLIEAPTPALRSRLEDAVDSVRRIALSLRPSMLDDLGLVAALEWQAREVAGRAGIDIEVQAAESAGELPESHRTCIFRVAQEALRNCARHSGATKVRVALDKAVRGVTLAIEDNGRGFGAGRTRGLGLLGMEERVSQLGGSFRLQSEPGRGTTVLAELPL
jgi:signal transduction histidine kinase